MYFKMSFIIVKTDVLCYLLMLGELQISPHNLQKVNTLVQYIKGCRPKEILYIIKEPYLKLLIIFKVVMTLKIISLFKYTSHPLGYFQSCIHSYIYLNKDSLKSVKFWSRLCQK